MEKSLFLKIIITVIAFGLGIYLKYWASNNLAFPIGILSGGVFIVIGLRAIIFKKLRASNIFKNPFDAKDISDENTRIWGFILTAIGIVIIILVLAYFL